MIISKLIVLRKLKRNVNTTVGTVRMKFIGKILQNKNKFVRFFLTYLILYLITAPILITINYSFAPMSILWNILFTPIIGFLYVLYAVFLFTPINFILTVPTAVLTFLFNFLSTINFEIIIGSLEIWVLFLYFLAVIAGMIFLKLIKKYWRVLPGLAIPYSFLLINPQITTLEQKVVFFDVGHGLSVLISDQINDTNILIDAPGGAYNSSVNNIILPYLKSHKIFRLDAFLVTHTDQDHFGGLEELKNNIEIDSVFQPSNALKKYNFGNLNIENIAYDFVNSRPINKNNNYAQAFKFNFMNREFYFPGDTEKEFEEWVITNDIDIRSDVYQVAHHGSKTSNSIDYLNLIRPVYSVISTNSNFNFPNPEVFRNLEFTTSKRVFVTKNDGMISFNSLLGINYVQGFSHNYFSFY